jgi:DNA-binding CsgD family transcriptional regulator
MIVVSPARAEQRTVLRTDLLAEMVEAVGSPVYSKACFRVLAESFDVDHWALFRYDALDTVRCLATASRAYENAAERNIDSFVSRCHKFDPALGVYRERFSDDPCLVKMAIGDIGDRQYRLCFEATHVHERLSFFAGKRDDVIQLCIYRGSPGRTFSPAEMRLFTSLARLIIATTSKHTPVAATSIPRRQLDIVAIERRLDRLPARLSKREREVCACAVLGKSIVETADALDIKRTSVVTYRQRAYEKLKIARQTDLLGLVYDVHGEAIQ